MEFFQAFGVSWKSLLAQLVNFAILLFILYKLAYKPMLAFMQDRQAAIARGVEDAKQAKALMEKTAQEQQRVIDEARKQATSIIEASRMTAQEQASRVLAQAKDEVARVVSDGKTALAAERSVMLQEVKKDVIGMVVASTEKILAGVIDDKVNADWLKSRMSAKKKA